MAQSAYQRFVGEVCHFRPSELLPHIAAAASELTHRRLQQPGEYLQTDPIVNPWALPAVARESIARGSELATLTASSDAVSRLCRQFMDLPDPMNEPEHPGEGLRGFLVRTASEQFRCQMSPFEEFARTCALYLDTAAAVPSAPAFAAAAWERSLGVSLEDFLGATFFLHVWASQNRGWVELDLLNSPNLAPILEALDAETICHCVDRHLAVSFAEFREREATVTAVRGLEEHRFNPLEARPLIRLRGTLLAPQPMFLLDRVTSTGVYYDRVHEPGFTDQLGDVFEAYVGRQLREIPRASVIGELEWRPGRRTVDWIVVLDEIVVLVEAKATRLTADARAGVAASLDHDIDRTLVHAHNQIEETANLIREQHRALAGVPSDRPLLGLVVTLEPYWLLGTPLTRIPVPTGATTPAVPISCRDLETLVSHALDGPIGAALVRLHEGDNRSANGLHALLPARPSSRNPLLDAGFALGTGWSDALREP